MNLISSLKFLGIYAMAGGLGLGTWDKIPSEQHVEIDMDNKIIHPRYSSRYFSYDLCMLKVIKEN